MLLRLLGSEGDFASKLLILLISVISLLPALTFHEWAHGFAAYKLGDNTAKADGRLSLNPIDHIDPLGSLMMLLVGFGWAKPVPVNTRMFRKPKRDMAIVSAAGPSMNFIVGFVSALLWGLAVFLFQKNGMALVVSYQGDFQIYYSSMVPFAIVTIFECSMLYNIGLGLFNLIPLPPLDGSNILMCLLPNHLAARYAQIRYYTRYIFLGLIFLSYVPMLNFIPELFWMPLNFLRNFFVDNFQNFAGWIFGLF